MWCCTMLVPLHSNDDDDDDDARQRRFRRHWSFFVVFFLISFVRVPEIYDENFYFSAQSRAIRVHNVLYECLVYMKL